MNDANKISEYRVAVNMDVEMALYINARSEAEAIAKAEEIMYGHLDNDTVLRPSAPGGATGLDIDEIYCNISSAIEMK